MKVLSETHQKVIERVLPWVPIAYGLGFFTVTTHIYTLGIPVLQLLEPVYILVGAPLAAFLSGTLWLWPKVIFITNKLRQNIQDIRKKLTDLYAGSEDFRDSEEAEKYLSELLTAIDSVLLPTIGIFRFFASFIKRPLIVNKSIPAKQKIRSFKSRIKIVTTIAMTIYRGVLEIISFLCFVLIILVFCLFSYYYIMEWYLMAPKSWGGGKPVSVRLILDSKNIPLDAHEMRRIFKYDETTKIKEETISSIELKLHYSTNDAIYVRIPGESTEFEKPLEEIRKKLLDLNNEYNSKAKIEKIINLVKETIPKTEIEEINEIIPKTKIDEIINEIRKELPGLTKKAFSEVENKNLLDEIRKILHDLKIKTPTFSFNRNEIKSIIWLPGPDSDVDGVLDNKDECPDTPRGVKVDDKGCTFPNKVSIRLNIEFEFDKSFVKEIYHCEVKKVADFMRKYPWTKVYIEGHTDKIGSDDYNLKLSQKRADSVREYLIDKFDIKASRITAIGYGFTKPIGDNSTEGGMQINRRVEAVIETMT
jgi:outer membrane protein OmpA-like peptidoglycan-associated protein